MAAPFQSAERSSTLATRVAGMVERHLIDSHLQPGDRFPPERDLADRFGVSRTVVREAVRSLVAKGLLDVRHGSGMTIRLPTLELLTSPLAMMLKSAHPGVDQEKIMEVRRLLEVEIAGLAALRRSGADLDALNAIIQDTREIETSRERFVEWDVSFHSGLAAATRNKLFVLLLDSLASAMRRVREIGHQVPGTHKRAARHHAAILAAVAAGDATLARNAMNAHLDEAEETMRKALPSSPQTSKRGKTPTTIRTQSE